MVTTIRLNELTENTITLYEAVMVVAKRARQINNEERAQMDLNIGTEEIEEDFDEFPLEIQSQVFDRKIKPIKLAIGELVSGEINIVRSIDEEEVKNEEKTEE